MGVQWDQTGVWVEESGNDAGRGIFITGIMDSLEKSTQWHRLVFEVENRQNSPYVVTIYGADSLEFISGGELRSVKDVLKDPALSGEDKMNILEPFIQKRVYDHRDILLHDVAKRYLWIGFELYRQGRDSIRLKNISVYFPRQSWISYLPEVYQANDENHFLERYLAMFQTLYEDLNREIERMPLLFDVDTAEMKVLQWLAEWLDISGSYMWSQEQLRTLLSRAVELYKNRGTREGILEFIRLYTGSDAYLVEYHHVSEFMKQGDQKTLLTRLYGLNPYVLTVILRKEAVPTQKEYKSLIRVMKEVIPVQMELNLVVLEPYIFLGGHTYLGINSKLGEYRSMMLDGLSMMPFSVIQDEPIS